MSEFTLKLHQAEGPPDRVEAQGTRWLWLDDAARLMGLNEGTLRRRCGKEWHARCLARMADRSNGQKAWQVSELADPRLAAASVIDENEVDVSKLTDGQRAEFARRLRLLNGWRSALDAGFRIGMNEAETTDRYLHKLATEKIECSRRTLYRLRAAWDMARGPAGLLDKRWSISTASEDAADDRFTTELKRLYLNQNRRSISRCADMAAEAAGLAFTPALYKAAQRIIAAIPRETVVLYREGSKAFTNQIETHIDRDWSQIGSNDLWCSDHHRFDVFVEYVDQTSGEVKHARPWLTAIQDLRSRKIVGYSIFIGHDPNAQIIVRTLIGAVRACGRPVAILLDNGKDFDSRIVTGLTKKQRRDRDAGKLKLTDDERAALGGTLSVLDIEPRHAWKYHGQTKPIERWFRSVSEQFSKLFDTYCGKDTATRPEELKKRMDAGRAPGIADFMDAFDGYVRDRVNGHVHLGDSMHGRTPDQAWAECLRSRDVVPDALLDWARLTRVKVRVRQKAVVELPGSGVRYGRGEQPLIDRMGEDVVIAYDPDQMGSAWLCEPADGKAICQLTARDSLSPDATEQDLRRAIAEKNQVKKRARDYMESRPRMGLDVVELARLADSRKAKSKREQLAATGTDPGELIAHAPLGIVRTPFGGHSIPTQSNPASQSPAAPTSRDPAPREGDASANESPALGSIFSYRRTSREADDE